MLNLSEEAKAARKAYQREWARKHPDKVKQHQERYWEKRGALRTKQQPPAGNAEPVRGKYDL